MPYSKRDFNHLEDFKLSELWNKLGEHSFHLKQRSPTLSDLYYRSLVVRILEKWVPNKPEIKILKFDLYNEATWTRYGCHFMRKGIPVYYIDIALSILQKATLNAEKSKLKHNFFPILGDFRKVPFGDKSFDVTCSFGSIEHVPEWESCIQEQIRVTKKNGIVIVAVPNLQNVWLRYHSYLLLDFMNVLKKYTSYEMHFQPWFLKRKMEALGLKNVEITGYHLFPKQLRWFDLWSEKYPRSALKRFKNLFLRPLLNAFYYLECKDTKLNLLSEMIITRGFKNI